MENKISPMIEIRSLNFAYPDAPRILTDINFSVLPGERIAIAGPNGAGKTTLFLNMTGLVQGTGEIVVKGVRLEKHAMPSIRRSMGMVFQSPDDQLFSTRVYDDVAYGLVYQGMEKEEIDHRVQRALADVGMLDSIQAVPYHLSLGQKKRVAIASVLSMQPDILLFDEPTMGLDARAQKQFIQIAKNLSQTILVATHDMRLAATLCSRLLILDEGRLVYDGPLQGALQDAHLLEKHGLERI
ncbi:MAG: ABC transporter ATP-binding protein [Chloroflexi bacterium]|nr:ABC transporter ATP-binding protein [Chloroflexota bacterium]